MKHIAIFGVPRSGTSWLGQIFNSSEYVAYRYQPNFAYSFPITIGKESSQEDIEEFHSELLKTEDPFVCQKKNISGNETPNFNKNDITHLVWKEVRYLEIMENLIESSDINIIGIIRHPCGVIKSWMNAHREYDPSWNIFDEWRFAKKKNKTIHEYYGFEKWVEATEIMLELRSRYISRMTLIKYENLLSDPVVETQRLVHFSNLPYTSQIETFLKESTSKPSDDPYDVYRINKRPDEWKNTLPVDIVEDIMNDKRFLHIQNRL
jgi:hypothetical protein